LELFKSVESRKDGVETLTRAQRTGYALAYATAVACGAVRGDCGGDGEVKVTFQAGEGKVKVAFRASEGKPLF
jgi:hypothetical protein